MVQDSFLNISSVSLRNLLEKPRKEMSKQEIFQKIVNPRVHSKDLIEEVYDRNKTNTKLLEQYAAAGIIKSASVDEGTVRKIERGSLKRLLLSPIHAVGNVSAWIQSSPWNPNNLRDMIKDAKARKKLPDYIDEDFAEAIIRANEYEKNNYIVVSAGGFYFNPISDGLSKAIRADSYGADKVALRNLEEIVLDNKIDIRSLDKKLIEENQNLRALNPSFNYAMGNLQEGEDTILWKHLGKASEYISKNIFQKKLGKQFDDLIAHYIIFHTNSVVRSLVPMMTQDFKDSIIKRPDYEKKYEIDEIISNNGFDKKIRKIKDIVHDLLAKQEVTSFVMPTWKTINDKGESEFLKKASENIKKDPEVNMINEASPNIRNAIEQLPYLPSTIVRNTR